MLVHKGSGQVGGHIGIQNENPLRAEPWERDCIYGGNNELTRAFFQPWEARRLEGVGWFKTVWFVLPILLNSEYIIVKDWKHLDTNEQVWIEWQPINRIV